MGTVPTRIDQELFDLAKSAGKTYSRSAAQQLVHWARLGRQLEASPTVTHDAIERVLTGAASYDELSAPAQAVVRTAWDEAVAERVDALDLEAELRAGGLPWSEADADGNVRVSDPGRS